MLEHYEEEYDGFVVLCGGYVAFLEGLTDSFGDVDFFVISKERVTLLKLLKANSNINKRLRDSSFELCGSIIANSTNLIHANVSKTSEDIVYFPSLSEKISFNIIPIQNHRVSNWQEAAEYVLSNLSPPICAVALTSDLGRLMRLEQASLKLKYANNASIRDKLKSIKRREKYRKKTIHFGQVNSLQKLALNFLLDGANAARCHQN